MEAKKYYLLAANNGDIDIKRYKDATPATKIINILLEQFDPIFAIKCYNYLDQRNLYILNKFIIDLNIELKIDNLNY